MNDRIANLIASFRSRLAALDLSAHLTVWQNQPPLAFTAKVAAARAATQTLIDLAARQSAPAPALAAAKRKEEKELEDAAHRLARAVVIFATDTGDIALAGRYDQPLTAWRALRDEVLLQRARLLAKEVAALAAGPQASAAADYGLSAASAAALDAEADDYAALIVAPQDALAARSTLTASLPEQARATSALFDQLEDLLPQFAVTPAGEAFVNAYLAAAPVIARGRGPATEPARATSAETPAAAPAPSMPPTGT